MGIFQKSYFSHTLPQAHVIAKYPQVKCSFDMLQICYKLKKETWYDMTRCISTHSGDTK